MTTTLSQLPRLVRASSSAHPPTFIPFEAPLTHVQGRIRVIYLDGIQVPWPRLAGRDRDIIHAVFPGGGRTDPSAVVPFFIFFPTKHPNKLQLRPSVPVLHRATPPLLPASVPVSLNHEPPPSHASALHCPPPVSASRSLAARPHCPTFLLPSWRAFHHARHKSPRVKRECPLAWCLSRPSHHLCKRGYIP